MELEQAKLKELRLLTLGDEDDESRDALLKLLYSYAQGRLAVEIKRLTGDVAAVPSDLSWIITELTIKRFNRIGSEGFLAESVEGHNVTFNASDLDEYQGILQDYYAPDKGKVKPGKVVIW